MSLIRYDVALSLKIVHWPLCELMLWASLLEITMHGASMTSEKILETALRVSDPYYVIQTDENLAL